jgi:hypothetical protein
MPTKRSHELVDYIKSNLGGYGLYYRSVMAELEVIYPGGPKPLPYPLDVPSERGKTIAAAFRRAIQHTRYYRDSFDHPDQSVPREVVQEYIHAACLCQLQREDAPDRKLLLDTFLHGGDARAAAARRETLRLFLDLAAQTDGSAVGQDAFRQLLLFGAEMGGATYTPQEPVALTYRRWRLYQAREYYAFALNGLWWHLCDWGIAEQGDLRPLPIEAFHEHICRLLTFDPLAHQLGVAGPGLGPNASVARLLSWLRSSVGADEAGFDARCRLEAPIHEYRLYALAYDEASSDPQIFVRGRCARTVHVADMWQRSRPSPATTAMCRSRSAINAASTSRSGRHALMSTWIRAGWCRTPTAPRWPARW